MDVVIENGIEVISGTENFYCECKCLRSVEIPDSVTCIGDNTFSGCQSLEHAVIPENVTSIGDYAFGDCRNLTNAPANSYARTYAGYKEIPFVAE